MKKQFQMPDEIMAKVQEIVAANRKYAGFVMEDGGEQDEDEAGLLDGEADSDESDQSDSDDDEGDEESSAEVDDLMERLEARIAERFDSIADRRVNALLKEIRKQDGKKPEEESSKVKTPTADSSKAEAREARLVYREYVGDKIRFLGDVEREHASLLASSLVNGHLSRGLDPEEAGRKAADEVASSMKGLRKHYEQKTLAALRRTGQIDPDTGGQTTSKKKTRTDGSGFQKGQAKAAELFGDRKPADQ